jgi:hypothetical protein
MYWRSFSGIDVHVRPRLQLGTLYLAVYDVSRESMRQDFVLGLCEKVYMRDMVLVVAQGAD